MEFRDKMTAFARKDRNDTRTEVFLTLRIEGFRFRLDWQFRFLPPLPPAGKSAGLGPSHLLELPRHTGARIFIGSSTVGNKPSRMRKAKFFCVGGYTVGRHPDSATSLQRARCKSLRRPYIKQNNGDITLPELTELLDRDAERV
jgi:hypothetical protein